MEFDLDGIQTFDTGQERRCPATLDDHRLPASPEDEDPAVLARALRERFVLEAAPAIAVRIHVADESFRASHGCAG
ncbi:MAG: hypothetical protein ABIF77_06635, partial [bacterium]